MPAELAQDAFSYCLHTVIMNLTTDANESSSIGDLLKTLLLVSAAYASAESGQAVRLEQDDDDAIVVE